MTAECPAAPVAVVTGLDMRVAIRIDDEIDQEIVRLALEMAQRRSRPVVLDLPWAKEDTP